jgi:hypothetical protein
MSEPITETIKDPMHPRRLEKNANITLKSALLPQAVSHAIGVEKRIEISVFELERPERREFGAKNQKA